MYDISDVVPGFFGARIQLYPTAKGPKLIYKVWSELIGQGKLLYLQLYHRQNKWRPLQSI